MRRILAETVIIVVETALVLALVAAFGVPGGRKAKAVTEAVPTFHCGPSDATGGWSGGTDCGVVGPWE